MAVSPHYLLALSIVRDKLKANREWGDTAMKDLLKWKDKEHNHGEDISAATVEERTGGFQEGVNRMDSEVENYCGWRMESG